MMTEPDMTNKLGVLRRTNVLRLYEHHKDAFTSMIEMGKLTDLSRSTMQNCFGAKMVTAPSNRTMEKICRMFQIPEGKIDRADFDPGTDSNYVAAPVPNAKKLPMAPVIVPQTQIRLQIGKTSIDTTVDAEIAQRVLKLIVLGDDI